MILVDLLLCDQRRRCLRDSKLNKNVLMTTIRLKKRVWIVVFHVSNLKSIGGGKSLFLTAFSRHHSFRALSFNSFRA